MSKSVFLKKFSHLNDNLAGCRTLHGCSVVSNSLWPHGLFSPWDFPGKNTEWVAISSSKGFSQPRNQTRISCIGRWILYHWVKLLIIFFKNFESLPPLHCSFKCSCSEIKNLCQRLMRPLLNIWNKRVKLDILLAMVKESYAGQA